MFSFALVWLHLDKNVNILQNINSGYQFGGWEKEDESSISHFIFYCSILFKNKYSLFW